LNQPGGTLNPPVETLHATSLQTQTQTQTQPQQPQPINEFMQSISPKPKSLMTILRSYKSAVTHHAHRLGYDFSWQTRFHDHIIRNAGEYQRIANYIVNNPKNWGIDKFHKK
jgi:hypothetical protein